MLHAPISETKTENVQSKSRLAPTSKRELQPFLPGSMGNAISNHALAAQPYQTFAGLQSIYGNQAILRTLHTSPQVARINPLRPSQGVMLQRKCACGGSSESAGECAECKAEREATLQRHAANVSSSRVNDVPPIVHDVLGSPWRSLDADTRAFMEPRFGHDFSQVRVHADARAAESARAVNALAYTVGRDVVFGAGQYAPGTSEGKRLMAHELTHVVQQKDETANVGIPMKSDVPKDAFEQQASIIAQTIVQGGFLSPQAAISESPGDFLIQRQTADAGTTKPSPTPTTTWTSNLITITLASDQPNCLGITTPSGSDPYNDCLPDETIKAPFCHGTRVPFEVDFYVDRADTPRPQPFKAPKVSLHFQFVTSSGKVSTDVQKTDPAPRYVSPNMPLEPTFGRRFPISTDVSGTLYVRLELQDVSGVNLVHAESIRFIVEPCV